MTNQKVGLLEELGALFVVGIVFYLTGSILIFLGQAVVSLLSKEIRFGPPTIRARLLTGAAFFAALSAPYVFNQATDKDAVYDYTREGDVVTFRKAPTEPLRAWLSRPPHTDLTLVPVSATSVRITTQADLESLAISEGEKSLWPKPPTSSRLYAVVFSTLVIFVGLCAFLGSIGDVKSRKDEKA